MKVRLALLSSRGASGSVDALAETSPVGAPGINATIFHSGSVTARPPSDVGSTESKRLTMANLKPSLCLSGINLLHTAPDRETTAHLLRMVQQPPDR